MAANNIIKGDELMIFKDGQALAFATAHTLTVTGNTVDISSKDHGFWGASDIGNITWEATTDNLYTEDAYDELFNAMLTKSEVDILFGYASNYNANGLDLDGTATDDRPDSWTYSSAKGYKGKAILTSLTTNANTGENATFSATFTGKGAIINLKAASAVSATSQPH